MTTRFIRDATERVANEKGEITTMVTSRETALLDNEGNEIGRVHAHQSGVSFQTSSPNFDVVAMHDAMINFLTTRKEKK
jgi:hypothetical protein